MITPDQFLRVHTDDYYSRQSELHWLLNEEFPTLLAPKEHRPIKK